jgi:hypothetical protein
MKIEKPEQFPTKEILELQISDSLECSSRYSEKGKISFKLVDVNGDELSIEELVKRYFTNPGDYFIYEDDRKEETRQDGIEDIKLENKEQKNYAVCEQLEEHISREENDDKSHIIPQNNENNIENAQQSIEENVLSTKKEQIEHSKPSADQDLEENDPEYIYGNEEDEEHPEKSMIINGSNPLVQNSASIDLEWIPFEGEYCHNKTRITSAAFCTNQGKRTVLVKLFKTLYIALHSVTRR